MEHIDIERDITIKKLIKIREERDDYVKSIDINSLLDHYTCEFKQCTKVINKYRTRSRRIENNFIKKHNKLLFIKESPLKDLTVRELLSHLSHNRLKSNLQSYKCPNPLTV